MKKKIIIGIFIIVAILIVLSMFGEEEQKKPHQIVPASGGGFVKSPQNPVLKEGNLDSWMILKGDPVVIKDGEIYKMWFAGAGEKGVHIAYAISEDGINWNVHPDPVFSWGKPGSWDAALVETPFVMKDEGIYKMWYEAWTTENIKEIEIAASEGRNILPAIGYATSKDGIHWERYGDKPVIGQRQVLWYGKPDNFVSFTDPHVIKEDGIYKMWFHANGVPRPDGRDVHSIGYATSKDGIKWDLHPNNPVFDVGPKGSFESIAVVQPSIAKINGVYEMWYGANPTKDMDASTEGIKSLKSYIGHATSKDGINWVRDPNNPIFGPEASGSGSWEEDGAWAHTVLLDGDTLKIWYTGVGRQGKWYPEDTNGFQYQIGYAEKKDKIT